MIQKQGDSSLIQIVRSQGRVKVLRFIWILIEIGNVSVNIQAIFFSCRFVYGLGRTIAYESRILSKSESRLTRRYLYGNEGQLICVYWILVVISLAPTWYVGAKVNCGQIRSTWVQVPNSNNFFVIFSSIETQLYSIIIVYPINTTSKVSSI